MDEQLGQFTAVIEETSAEFLGYWNRLVSTTNWEKGRIVAEWRQRLSEAAAPPATWTDEAWSQCVGNVSPQHVGRLRRVYQRFGAVAEQYPGLYWSHFQAALDWPDAEMYLEGAVANRWSITQMRRQRWEAMGALPDSQPEDEVLAAEYDEDAGPAEEREPPATISASTDEVRAPADDDFEPSAAHEATAFTGHAPAAQDESFPVETAQAEPIRPFEDLSPLPADLSDAFETFKLAILHHKVSGWREVSCQHVVQALEALKQLALAPAE